MMMCVYVCMYLSGVKWFIHSYLELHEAHGGGVKGRGEKELFRCHKPVVDVGRAGMCQQISELNGCILPVAIPLTNTF